MTMSASTANPGTTTPPNRAEWLTSSWRPRKYQGAFAGLGVFVGLANSSSGACQKMETAITVATVTSNATPSRKKAYGYEKTVSSSSSMLTVSKMGLPVTTSIRPYVLSFDAGTADSGTMVSGAPMVTNCAGFSALNFQTGRESPPSLRTRQKCTIVNSVTTAGSTATWSTYNRNSADEPTVWP